MTAGSTALFQYFVDNSSLENPDYFGNLKIVFSNELREGRELIANSWYRALKSSRRNDPHEEISPPMWIAGQLCDAATSDISSRFDFDFKNRIHNGDPLDPNDYQNMKSLESLHDNVNELHKKIDALTELFKSSMKTSSLNDGLGL